MGEENRLVYDEKLKRWVDKNAKPEDLQAAAAPPPPPVIKKKPSSISKPRSDSVSDAGSLKSPVGSSAPPLGGNGFNTSSNVGSATGAPSPALPPSRKAASPAVANDLDSLMGLSSAGSGAATGRGRKKRGGRAYVDVMSLQQKK